MPTPQDKAAEALRLAEQLDALVILDEVRSNNPLAKESAAMLREYAALLQAQPEASCMVERGETVDLTLIADPVRRAAFEAYHNTHSGHYDRLCAAIEAVTKAQPAEAQRVYLVPTGEVHEGQETYTQHEAPVPLADQEVLYTHPQPAEAGRVPPGWKLVPVEPTPEMVGAMAVVEASSVINGVRCVGISGAVEAFEAMLAAAPQPPKEQP